MHGVLAAATDPVWSYVQVAWGGFSATVFDPFYWVAIAVLMTAQLLWPAERDKRRPSRATVEDLTWFILSTVIEVTILAVVLAPLDTAYQHLVGGRAFDLTPALGVWGVAILGFTIGDLFGWFSHWLNHHRATLWYFHAVHHSQTNLNALSDTRQHVIETIFNAAFAYFPARALGLDSDLALKLAALTVYWCAIIHTNLRTNFGPLRYLVISPQAHRIHHSILHEHFNSNYGSFFVFWDYIFRTAHRDYNTYTPTGISDPSYPELIGKMRPWTVIDHWLRQTIYPFELAVRRPDVYSGNEATRTAMEAARAHTLPPAEARVPAVREPAVADLPESTPSPVMLMHEARESAVADLPESTPSPVVRMQAARWFCCARVPGA